MHYYIKNNFFIFTLVLPILSYATTNGLYNNVGIGIASGPSNVIAPSDAFKGSMGTLTGAFTDVYGLQTIGSVGAFANLGYKIKPYFSIEANYTYWGWQNLNSFTGQLTTATGLMSGQLYSQSVGGNLVGYLPLQSNINIFTKLGVAALFSEFSVNDPENVIFFNPGKYSQNNTKAGMLYGAGIQYGYNSNILLQLGWSGISQLGGELFTNLSYNLAFIGVGYVFQKN